NTLPRVLMWPAQVSFMVRVETSLESSPSAPAVIESLAVSFLTLPPFALNPTPLPVFVTSSFINLNSAFLNAVGHTIAVLFCLIDLDQEASGPHIADFYLVKLTLTVLPCDYPCEFSVRDACVTIICW